MALSLNDKKLKRTISTAPHNGLPKKTLTMPWQDRDPDCISSDLYNGDGPLDDRTPIETKLERLHLETDSLDLQLGSIREL